MDYKGVLKDDFDPFYDMSDDFKKSRYGKYVFTINKSKDNKPEVYIIECYKSKIEKCEVRKKSLSLL